MLKPLKLMEMPNLGKTMKKMDSDTSNYIYRLNNANDIDNLQARYEKYLEMEKKKEEERKKTRKMTKNPTIFSYYSRSQNYLKTLRSYNDLKLDNTENVKTIFKIKSNENYTLFPNSTNNIIENKNEKELILNLSNTKNIESSRNLKKKDTFEYKNTQQRKSKDIYSSLREDNKNMRSLLFKTLKYKNDISNLCNQINNTCLNFNTTIHDRPKYKFITEREIQDSITKKDLDLNENRKPKVNAFKNMQLFREVNTLTALSYRLAVDGNKVIKDYLNNNKKKSKYGSGQKLMKASFKIEAGSLNRIISIPSKTMNGYIYSGQKDDKKEKNDIVIKNGLINNILFEKENSNNKINKDYKLIIDNNTKFEKNIPTSEYVGPGSYDIFTKEKGNSVLKWSKGFNINKINNKNELIKVQKVLDEMKKNGESINNFNIDKKINLMHLCRTNSFHFLVGKYQRGLNDINRKMLDNNINNKINTSYYCRDSFILDKSQIPGPGYYSKELIDQQKDTLYYKEREIQKKKEQKNQKQLSLKNYRKMQFGEETPIKEKFGSNCERFLNKSKSMEYLGPTTYFNEKNKFEPNKKPDILHHLKFGKLVNSFENRDLLYNFQESNLKQNVKEQLNNLDKINNKNNKQTKSNSNLFLNRSIADNPGPGEYDLSGNFIIPSFSQTTVMSSQVERFPYIEENTPGPGAYINAQDFKNEKIEEKLKKIVNHSNYELQKLEKNKRIEEIKESNKIKNEIPGAGKYNPGLQETINYKILSKINKIFFH